MFEGIRKVFVFLMCVGLFLAIVTGYRWIADGMPDISSPLDLLPW